ncbi:MAG: adenosylcobinamide amidohydrolase [Acidimicrobiales bacterium]
MDQDLHARVEHGHHLHALAWRLPDPRLVITSAPLGGGIGERHWVLNVQVARGYDDDEPARHLTALASDLGLSGQGVGMMTAVDVRDVIATDDSEVEVWATVGVESPSRAAAPDEVQWRPRAPGTINVVASLPWRLSDAALVNAVATVAEAKAQAFADIGLDGTGTPTDATCIVCPTDGPAEPYGGPRSRWGAPLARAVHAAVTAGLLR